MLHDRKTHGAGGLREKCDKFATLDSTTRLEHSRMVTANIYDQGARSWF